jgi:isopentenyl phosphate kinase
MIGRLVFLKLGGSLITIKNQPRTPRREVIVRLALEIAKALEQDPGMQLVLGHGSGSFGHTPASLYHTREGVKTVKEWEGFKEVQRQAAELNSLVMAALEKARLPVICVTPSERVITRKGKVAIWDIDPIQAALKKGDLPVVYGDVAYDQEWGGTILSTEDLFSHLARALKPAWMLFAGLEPGVWADYPTNSKLLKEITPSIFPEVVRSLTGSSATDVTGGMLSKVQMLITLVSEMPFVQGLIFTGEKPGNVRNALLGEQLGTIIHAG